MTRLCTFLFSLLLTIGQAQPITGLVRDAQTNVPVAGVTVQILSLKAVTLTDQHGRFKVEKQPAGTYQVRLSAVGYQPTNVPITVTEAVASPLKISLVPTVIQLNQQKVITTQRREITDFDRPEFTSILTTRALHQRVPRTVPEALMGVTGVFVQKTNHGGGSPFLRGLSGQQILLLVDGIRLNNSTFRSGPNQYLNTVDPQSVRQIEVLRSSGSVSYGSDAIGGVVNILTKTPQFSDQPTVSGSAFAKIMSHNMAFTSHAELGVSTAAVAVLGGLTYSQFGDLVAGSGLGLQAPTGYNQLSGDVKARVRLSGRLVATAAYQSVRQTAVPVYHRVALENYRYYRINPQQRQLAYARLDGFFDQPFLQSVQLTVLRQNQAEVRRSQKNNSPTAVEERDQTNTTGLTLVANAQPTRHWQFQNGIEWYVDAVTSRRDDMDTRTGVSTAKRGLYPDGATMSSLAAFTNHTLTVSRLTLTAGGRYNAFRINVPEANAASAVTIRPSALVGNVGLSVAVLPALRVVSAVQSAFRAPNIDDLGTLGIVDFRYETPTATLSPERSLTMEAGLKLRTRRVSATLLTYHNRLTDFISRVRVGPDSVQGYPVYAKQNSAESFIRGLETEAEFELRPNWLVYGNLTYTYGQNVTANEPFRRIPPLNGRLGLTYQATAGWWVRVEALLAGAQTRLGAGDIADNRIAKSGTPGWQVLNLNGGYRWKTITLSAEWQNLTNEAYRTHGSGVDGVGSSVWVSVLATL